MKATKLGARFFDSTRGRIVSLLRRGSRTVNELAEELELTDNAVRSHLFTLERDGLVRQSGTLRGHRKPHFAYQLTSEAEHLFPKAYDVLFNQLVSVLRRRLSNDELQQILREVGRTLGEAQAKGHDGNGLKQSALKVLKVVDSLGGSAKVEYEKDRISISGSSCPLATAVTEHPEVCALVQALIEEVAGVPVQESCDRSTQQPRCRFEIVKPT